MAEPESLEQEKEVIALPRGVVDPNMVYTMPMVRHVAMIGKQALQDLIAADLETHALSEDGTRLVRGRDLIEAFEQIQALRNRRTKFSAQKFLDLVKARRAKQAGA